jgi:hypothetical protein
MEGVCFGCDLDGDNGKNKTFTVLQCHVLAPGKNIIHESEAGFKESGSDSHR